MPFIAPRLGAKTVESIWTEAASSDLTLCPKCDDVAEPVPGGKRQCISCYHTFTPEQKTAAADPSSPEYKEWLDNQSWDPTAPVGFTSNPHYEGWDGKDPMATTPKPGPDCNCERCVNDPYSPRNRARTAFTHDEIDWTDIEPGSPECASYRPSDRDETLRMVRREDDRRKTPRDAPERRQSTSRTAEKTVLTIPEYRARVDAEKAKRGPYDGLRGLHNFSKDVEVPGASHSQLVRTDECFSPGCPDHGWM